MVTEERQALSRLQTLSGMRLWNLSSALAAVYAAMVAGTYATGYALHLGATEAMIGFLSAAPSIGQFLQLFSPLISERRQRRKPWCVSSYFTGYGVWIPIALIPFVVPAPMRAWVMILLVFAGGTATAMANPAALSWLTDLVPRDLRGRFVARQQSLIALLGLIATILAGKYMDYFEAHHLKQAGFTSMFIIATGFGMASLAAWILVAEPPSRPSGEHLDVRLLALPFRHENFRNLTVFVAVRTMAVMMAAPFFAVYMLKSLQIPYTQIALFFGVATVFSILSNPFWGYLADKYGYKPILRITSFGIALNPLPWFFTTKDNYLWLIPASQVWGGFFAAGLTISQFNLMLKTAPDDNRSVYIGFYSAVTNVAMAIGSVLGGLIAHVAEPWQAEYRLFGNPISHLQIVFMFSALFRLLGLRFLLRVREFPEISARTVIRHVGSGNPLVTGWNLMRMARTSDPEAKTKATKALGQSGSTLAVDELIAELGDTERDVRREAARSLGMIGDERALFPLIDAVLNPDSDMVEEAVEALGKIASPRSMPALMELLDDERPTVRKSAVRSLADIGGREAVAALEELLETERDASVFLTVTEALSRSGGTRALHRLRQLLHKSSPGVQRRQLANSIGNLLGDRGDYYRLLQTDALQQEEMVARRLRRARRRLLRRVATPDDRAPLQELLDLALEHFEHRTYRDLVHTLRQAASRAVRSLVEQYPPETEPDAPTQRKVGLLMEANERLRLNFGYLSGLVRDSRSDLNREEALLAVFALDQVVRQLVITAAARPGRPLTAVGQGGLLSRAIAPGPSRHDE